MVAEVYLFKIDNGQAVSMAGVARRLKIILLKKLAVCHSSPRTTRREGAEHVAELRELSRQLHRVRAEGSGLAPLLWRIEQRRQLTFQHPSRVADLPDRHRLFEASLHHLDLGVIAVELDHVEATGIGALPHQQTVFPIGAHPVWMLEALRGLELGDPARLTALAHLDAQQPSGRVSIGVAIS